MYSDDIILSEVLARVVFRLVVNDWRRWPEDYACPNTGIIRCSQRLAEAGFSTLSFWCVAAAFETRRRGCRLADWRDLVVRRARLHDAFRRQGRGWRRASSPPVSNTGATGTALIVRPPWGQRRARCDDDPIR